MRHHTGHRKLIETSAFAEKSSRATEKLSFGLPGCTLCNEHSQLFQLPYQLSTEDLAVNQTQ